MPASRLQPSRRQKVQPSIVGSIADRYIMRNETKGVLEVAAYPHSQYRSIAVMI